MSPSRYHHGDLKAALVDGAVELIAERGVRGFSLAELSRRVGVTVAAPYRHFADRDELLAAVAVRAVSAFEAALTAALYPDRGSPEQGSTEQGSTEQGSPEQGPPEQGDDGGTPEQRAVAIVRGYVRFAAQQRPLFDVLYGAGLDKSRYPELQRAWVGVDDLVISTVKALYPDDADAADELQDALEATAHGHAMLLLDGSYGDGSYGDGPEAVEIVADRAARAALALIRGRAALRP